MLNIDVLPLLTWLKVEPKADIIDARVGEESDEHGSHRQEVGGHLVTAEVANLGTSVVGARPDAEPIIIAVAGNWGEKKKKKKKTHIMSHSSKLEL